MNEHFADVLSANSDFARSYDGSGLVGGAARRLAVVTCMDPRIDPLALLGLELGDAYILRNAGAQVAANVLDTLVLATRLLGVERVLIVAHTDCRMTKSTEDEIHAAIEANSGLDTRAIEFGAIADQSATLARDVERVRNSPLIAPGLAVLGCVYDLASGRLDVVIEE